jgi:hypothetical protein
MNISSVDVGDLVRVNRKGYVFLAEVTGKENGQLKISPVVHNISFFHATAREIEAHWRKSKRSR